MAGPLSVFSHKDLLSVDMNGHHLKIAHARVSNLKREIVHLLEKDIKGMQDGNISQEIEALVSELNIKNPIVYCPIPSQIAMTKNIEIPSVKPQEIKDIINLQASRHTPYAREEIIIEYIDIGSYKHSYTKVVLIILPSSVVKRQFYIFSKLGITPKNVIFLPEAMAWFVSKTLGLENKDLPNGIIHVDEKSLDFIVVFRNKPIFLRNISTN